jgi:hypothetical protein
MNVLPELITILEEADLGTAGESLFIDDIPVKIDRATMVRLSSSIPVDTDVPILRPSIQVIRRDKTTSQAIDYLYQVIELLHTFNEQEWGDIEVMQCHCISEPQFLSKDESGRVAYTTTFQLHIRWNNGSL